MRKIGDIEEKSSNINPEVLKREHQLFCPYCNAEMFHEFNTRGSKGQLICDKCQKQFGFTFGKIVQPINFIGYMNVQGRIRMIINGVEETYNLSTDKKMAFKRADETLILWKKGLFKEYRPREVINYTNYFRIVV